MGKIINHLGALRRKRGLSAIHLAERVGVSRQTIHAIEAGTYVPNTAVALQLARTLESTVEELFVLAGETDAGLRLEQAELLPGCAEVEPGQPVQLCRVDERLMATSPSAVPWCFPSTDGVVDRRLGANGKSEVRVFPEEDDFGGRILIAGCDPGISVLAKHAQGSGLELVLAHRNSSQALALLKAGDVHVAGTHLRDEESGESNLPAVGRLFAKNAVAVISFAVWEEGIVAARNNPRGIRTIEDFARADVTVVNRERGSGSRALLDSRLAAAGIGRSASAATLRKRPDTLRRRIGFTRARRIAASRRGGRHASSDWILSLW